MIRLPCALTRWQLLLPRAVSFASHSSIVDPNPAAVPDKPVAAAPTAADEKEKEVSTKPVKPRLVAEAFANLSKPSDGTSSKKSNYSSTHLEKKINEATTVEQLLHIASTPNLSRKMALKLLSIIGDWTAAKKIKLSDFEGDVRFISMCRVLSQDKNMGAGMGDLATVLGVTGDDEAAKLISSASMSQMARVSRLVILEAEKTLEKGHWTSGFKRALEYRLILEKLSANKKRSPPLLRSLAFNISKSDEKLNIKQCADVLFAMANLSFHDEVLLVKTCSDAYASITKETKSSVIGSVARSLGILRCRDAALLDKLSDWLLENMASARPQDAVALIMALATVDFHPTKLEELWKAVSPNIRPLDLPTSSLYLDAVWSSLLLDKLTSQQTALVLASDFVEKLRKEDGSKLLTSTTLKLLNIDAAAQSLITNYQGPRLATDIVPDVSLSRSKDKTILVNCVMDSLLNLLPGENFLRRDVDSGAGFLIDGECVIGSNCTPLPVVGSAGKNGTRVAIMVLGYYDTCVGARFQPNGVHAYYRRLLEARGYKVLTVLHSEFSPSSKLVQRVQFLEHKLKTLVSS